MKLGGTYAGLYCLGITILAMLVFAAQARADGDSEEPSQSATYTLAVKTLQKKDYGEAARLLMREVEENGNNADAFNLLGYSHRNLGNLDLALEFYLRALAINPKHRGAHEYLGETYLKMENLAGAKRHLAKLDDLCWLPCKQYTDLKEAIQRYEAGKRG